jgi:hypothetical protein
MLDQSKSDSISVGLRSGAKGALKSKQALARKLVWASAPILLVIVGAAWIQTAAFTQFGESPGPRLELPSCPLDLGAGKPGTILHGSFTIKNRGAMPLRFTIAPACACTELEPSSGELLPQEAENVLVGVKLDHYGLDRFVNLRIQTNDADRGEMNYQVIAKCPLPFRVEPVEVDFGSQPAGVEVEAAIQVFGDNGNGARRGDDFVVESASGAIELTEQASGKFIARLSKGLRGGYFHDRLRITQRSTGESLSLPVSGYGVEEVLVAPRVLSISPDVMNELTLIVWRGDGKALGTSIETICPPGWFVEETSNSSAKRRQFHVRAIASQTLSAATIELRFNGCERPVVVPCRVKSVN